MRTEKPIKVKIGYRFYNIKFVDKIDGEQSHGQCIFPKHPDHGKGRIKIKKGQDALEKSNTLFHEITHAIIRDKGLELADATEERIVCAITNGWTTFIMENPKVMKQIIRLINKGYKDQKKKTF